MGGQTMRPKLLTMSAFGAYAGKQAIDFEKLGKSGLYLVTGDTGAGKTTIFDAISFALFGNASGEIRDSKMLRSKLAEPDTQTYVELIFDYNGKEYTVKRNPEYERPAKRGDGTTKQTADAELILPDSKNPISKVNEVTEYIEKLLGINRDQFSQIAMIAQGEFQKLLNADSKSRREIFRKLFKTEKYNELEEALKTEANQLYHDYELAKQSINQYANGILCDKNETKLASRVNSLKNGDSPISEAVEMLDDIIESDSQKEEDNGKLIEKNTAELVKINAKLEQKTELSKARETLEQKNSDLVKKSAELKVAQKTKEEADAKLPEADKLRKQATSLEKDLDLYKELEECRNNYESAKKSYNDATKRKEESDKLLEKLAAEEKKLSDEYKECVSFTSKSAKLASKQAQLRVQISSIKKIADTYEELQELEEESNEAKEQYEICRDNYLYCNDEYNSANLKFLDEQAGILASELKDNEPCPVCGSLEHPDPASIISDAPTQDDLEKLKEDCNIAEKDMMNASRESSRLAGRLQTTKSNITSLVREFTEKKNLNNALKEVTEIGEKLIEEYRQIEKELEVIEKKSVRQEQIEQLLTVNGNNKDKAKEELSNAKTSEGIEKTRMENAEKRGNTLANKLRYKTIDEAKKQIDNLTLTANMIATQSEDANKKYTDIKTELAELTGIIAQLKKQLEGAPKFNDEEIDAKFKELNEEKIMLDAIGKELSDRIRANRRTKKNLETSIKQSKSLLERYDWLRNLSDTANGGLKGRDKIMLEIYVQTRFFDRIIERANSRFFIMTGGQFELKRAENVVNKTSQGGLDLNVIDHHNGSERSVKSLSGGESFMASLSLALGLSDEIQASAGGIKLETMFIDEGFGTLDAETLKQAMDALSALADPDGGKLVGIISHVDELKNRIDKQIIVTKDKDGISTAKISA